ncbi:MAG: hypothetical protein E6K03_06530 [Methanobacteriota archaeon]|nr:MAG: hypothetical protein E6K03_06530 [Euryarchaeota archaeon]
MKKMERFGLLHHEVREQRPYRRFSHLVVKAPSGQIPLIWSTRLAETHATAEGRREKLHRTRREYLSASNVNPVMGAYHPLDSPFLNPEISVTVDDAREIA